MPRTPLHPACLCSPALLLTHVLLHVLRSVLLMIRASLHPARPCSALLRTHAQCSTSPCFGCSPLCCQHMRRAPFHPACLLSALLLTHAPCLASPCSALLLTYSPCLSSLCLAQLHCPPHTRTMPRFTRLCSAVILTRALTLSSLSYSMCPASASDTCTVPHFTLLVSDALGVRRTLLCSFH